MKTKNDYTVILRSDSDEESFEDSSLRSAQQKRKSNRIFITRTGKPVSRTNIWRDMKKLCESAKVRADGEWVESYAAYDEEYDVTRNSIKNIEVTLTRVTDI